MSPRPEVQAATNAFFQKPCHHAEAGHDPEFFQALKYPDTTIRKLCAQWPKNLQHLQTKSSQKGDIDHLPVEQLTYQIR